MDLVIQKGRPTDDSNRLGKEIRTYDLLDSLGISYERVDHEATETMEACAEVDKILAPAVICKNLFYGQPALVGAEWFKKAHA